MVERVTTAGLHQQNLRDINLVQVDLANLNRQISSGRKAESYADLNGIVERISDYQAKLDGIDTYIKNNNVLNTRLNTMEQSVSNIQDLAAQFSSLLLLRNTSTNTASLNFPQKAQSILDQITDQLNTSLEGRFLFSGSKTDTMPVPKPISDMAVPGIADDHYYKGNNDVLNARVSDSVTIDYGVTANDDAFKDLISSIKTAIQADRTDDTGLLKKSNDMAQKSITELTTIRSKIGNNQKTIEDLNSQQLTMQTYWKQSLQDDTSTDVAAASIQLSVDQTVLQATYQAFASISRLRLTDFLN